MKRQLRRLPIILLVLVGLAGAEARYVPPTGQVPVSLVQPTPDHLPSPDGETVPLGAGGGPGPTSYVIQALALRAARSWTALAPPALAGGGSTEALRFLAQPSAYLQGEIELLPVADGQFVWGPNVGPFDLEAFLAERKSPLVPYAPEIALWASYTSVNPKLLLAALEFRSGLISQIPAGWSTDDVLAEIEDTSLTMATAFYEHRYTWGAQQPSAQRGGEPPPVLRLQDGAAVVLDTGGSSASFALAALLARSTDTAGFRAALAQDGGESFQAVFGSLFPSVDLLDASNQIDPPGTPPVNLLQMPFALGATWTFGGPHSWNGNSTPPFSSMDFFIRGGTCPAPPYQFSVAAASGTAYRPYGYSCWLEIAHGFGWTTSYYHLQNLTAASTAERNAPLGTIACEICAGGYATGPHVHFSLKYNGAYVSLEGVELSGWTVHVGPTAYYSGSIERGGVSLSPYSQVLNDYHLYFGSGVNTSLELRASAGAPSGRVLMPVDDPSNARKGPPLDVGASDDFMIDLWLRASPGANVAGAIQCGANDNWTRGNIVLDRRRTGGAGYGLSLAGGRPAFGVTGAAPGNVTLCGTTDVADGEWHLITLARNRWDGVDPDGFLWLFVDGHLEASGTGPQGDISYPDSAVASSPTDPFLAVGSDKYDAGPGFTGWVDELRYSNILRTRADFVAPIAPYLQDSNTAVLFHFDEGAGDIAYDTSGFGGGPSSARLQVAGVPVSPKWSIENPFAAWDGTATPSPTISPTPSSTPTASRTATATSSPTRTATLPSPTATSSSTATPTPSRTATTSPSSTSTPSSTASATASATPSATSSPTASESSTSTPSRTPSPTIVLPTATLIPTATPGGTGPPGDLNLDGQVNVIDVQLCINVVLGHETDPDVVVRADVNADGGVNVLDLQGIVNVILGG